MLEVFEKGYEYEKQGDYENALKLYTQAANQGDIRAQMNIGHIYRSGRRGEKNPKLAAEYYLQAAKQGAVGAQWRLGDMYEFGDGVDVDFKLAAYWYEKAAEQGEAKAQWRLAQLYENGEGVDFDIQTALKWYLKADTQNSSAAQWRIGRIYLYGKGVSQDYLLAKKWFDKANSQNDHPCAHLFLGYMCRDALISNASPQDAIEHWLIASKHPHPIGEISYNLGFYDEYHFSKQFKKIRIGNRIPNQFQNILRNFFIKIGSIDPLADFLSFFLGRIHGFHTKNRFRHIVRHSKQLNIIDIQFGYIHGNLLYLVNILYNSINLS
jgi:TPR repeat protein